MSAKAIGTLNSGRFPASVAGLVAVASLLVCSAPVSPVLAATNFRFSGALGGVVTDNSGKPQADAMVLLFNRQNRLLQRSATDAFGTFSFAELLPDLYSVQVSLNNFVPAMREQILIKPGMRSVLSVNLSKVFSSVQLISTTPLPGGLMSDTWKWTLRTDEALRPILRLLPSERIDSPSEPRAPLFTDSRGLIRISASEGVDLANASDLGTQFAFATSVYGGNHFTVAGDLGYVSASGTPSAAIRTTYSRQFAGASPSVSVTMRQLYMPMRLGQTMTGNPNESVQPVLRQMAVSVGDHTQLTDSTQLEYGFELDNVSYINHLQYFSPYAKLSHTLARGTADFTWTSGNARPELGMSASDGNIDLQRNLAALSMMPLVTLRDGVTRVQRGTDYEMGITERFGSRDYRISAYYDDVSNTTLTVASPASSLFPGDLVSDMMSNSALFNIGSFQTSGYTASVTQDLGENYHLTFGYALLGVMAPRSQEVGGTTADDLRRLMEVSYRPALTLRASGTVKRSGTRFVTSYEWRDYRSTVPGPGFSTQPGRVEPGLNVAIRQPIPSVPGVPGRIEASAELRNLLAQGYLPLELPGGQQLLLVNTPRSVRGGLAFIF